MFESEEYLYDNFDDCGEWSDEELLMNYIYMFGELYDSIWDMYLDEFEDYEY